MGSDTSHAPANIKAEEMDKLYIGQGYDLFWTFNIKSPSVDEYISMVDYSTYCLLVKVVVTLTSCYRDRGTFQHACAAHDC